MNRAIEDNFGCMLVLLAIFVLPCVVEALGRDGLIIVSVSVCIAIAVRGMCHKNGGRR